VRRKKPEPDLERREPSVSESRFRAFADHVADAYYLHGEDGVVLDVNQRACEMLGYTREELIGMEPKDFDAFAIDHAEEDIRALLASGKEARFDTSHRRKDGSTFPVAVRMFPCQEENHMLVMALVSDVTGHKRTEETVMRLNRELQAITVCHHTLLRADDEKSLLDDICRIIVEEAGYHMAWVGYVEHDENKSVRPTSWAGFDSGYIKDASLSWAGDSPNGQGPSGIAARSGNIIYIQDIATDPRMGPWRERALERGYRSSVALPLKGKDGGIFGVLAIYSSEAYAISTDEMRLLGELADDMAFGIQVLRMRVERDLTEEALRNNEERYRTIFRSSPLGLFRSTIDGQFVEVNPAMAEMFGYDSPEAMIREVADIGAQFYADAEQRRQVVFRQLNAPGDIMNHLNRYLRLDGSEITANLYLKTIRDADGNPMFFDGIIEDITERLQAEEAHQRLESQLVQAQKMESIGRLAGGVAHDFNNMLSAIMGYSDLALNRIDPNQKVHDYIQEVRNAANRSADLTRQLLAFARKQSVIPRVMDLNATVEGMLNMLRRMIGEGIQLDWFPEDKLWLVEMDPSQVDQILANLCVNASDAIDDVGSITIRTSNVHLDASDCADMHPDCMPGDFVCLSVTDDGCGMDEEILQNLFEPFYTTKEPGKGTGLGLSTVYGIVKQSKGFISIDSEPGNGTTFHIFLPRYAGKGEPKASERTGGEELIRGHETILVVEDETALLDIMQLVLKDCGYDVLAAASPAEAINLVRQHAETGDINLLITDMVMPEMNGRDLARSIALMYPTMKVLFMSGYTDNVISQEGVLDSDIDFIQKPFEMEALISKARELMDSD